MSWVVYCYNRELATYPTWEEVEEFLVGHFNFEKKDILCMLIESNRILDPELGQALEETIDKFAPDFSSHRGASLEWRCPICYDFYKVREVAS